MSTTMFKCKDCNETHSKGLYYCILHNSCSEYSHKTCLICLNCINMINNISEDKEINDTVCNNCKIKIPKNHEEFLYCRNCDKYMDEFDIHCNVCNKCHPVLKNIYCVTCNNCFYIKHNLCPCCETCLTTYNKPLIDYRYCNICIEQIKFEGEQNFDSDDDEPPQTCIYCNKILLNKILSYSRFPFCNNECKLNFSNQLKLCQLLQKQHNVDIVIDEDDLEEKAPVVCYNCQKIINAKVIIINTNGLPFCSNICQTQYK